MKRQKSNNILWIVLGLAAVGGLTYVVIKKTKQNKQQPIPNYKTGVLISSNNQSQTTAESTDKSGLAKMASTIRNKLKKQ